MALYSSFCQSPISNKINCPVLVTRASFSQRSTFAVKAKITQHIGKRVPAITSGLSNERSFIGGSRIVIEPKLRRFRSLEKSPGVRASWLATSQVASSVFTLGTAAVLPFYTLMVLAPKAELTRKSMQTTAPYVVLGVLYAYLLYLSWTPDTIKLMFASKYLLPELPGIAKMFSSEMTLASAWIHLLAVDLFAARQVFNDGLENGIETRHSISLCLLFCPVGIIAHVITKAITKNSRNAQQRRH